MLRFEDRLSFARTWEIKLARFARRRGWYVLATYDFNGKGDDKSPKLMAPNGKTSLVLPDLQCFRDGSQRWLECKYKKKADLYRKGNYLVTGISKRLLSHYERVQEVTKADVYVAFLHEEEREIRGNSLSGLQKAYSHSYCGAQMGPSGMVFWKYAELPRWADLAVLEEKAA